MAKHPIQPIEVDEDGRARFKQNAIVNRLRTEGPFDMNEIACWDVPREDREQFAQLIGYSLEGASELGYVTDETIETADQMHESGDTEQEARIKVLQAKLDACRKHIKALAPEIFAIHPDDLYA